MSSATKVQPTNSSTIDDVKNWGEESKLSRRKGTKATRRRSMVLGCFFNIFLTIVESFVVFKIIKDENTRESIDGISKLCFPLLFLIGTYGVMFKSLYNKSIVYNKLVHGDEIGISKDLYD